MNPFLLLLTSMAISMVIIPIMARLAPRLGLLDAPGARKVHEHPVARVGGWGIVFGVLLPMLIWIPKDRLAWSFIAGVVILFVCGAVDDRYNIGHYKKFIGQILAAAVVVYVGDLWIERLPFLGSTPLAPEIGKPFTIFAIVGLVNALNHSDGLDGLAGGEALLSLLAISALLFLHWDGINDPDLLIHASSVRSAMFAAVLAALSIGGLLGFLRYNTHPARVFMGDTGSQYLGFTLAFLAILYSHRVNPASSAALPALFIGLPVVDILAVLFLRAKAGMNLFRGTRNHIHHRLLDRGFSHGQSVMTIYSIQGFFAVAAILLCYQADAVILALYFSVSAAVFIFLTIGERRRAAGRNTAIPRRNRNPTKHGRRTPGVAATLFITIAVPIYLLGGSAYIDDVPRDFGLLAAALFALLLLGLAWRDPHRPVAVLRLVVYTTAISVVYLLVGDGASGLEADVEQLFFVLLTIALALAVRHANEFQITPMDYLVLLVLIGAGCSTAYSGSNPWAVAGLHSVVPTVLKVIIILYSCELLIARLGARWSPLFLSCLASLSVLGLRGLWPS